MSDTGFAAVADGLASERRLRSLVVGLGGGVEICSRSKSATDLTGRTSMPVLAALLEMAELFVGVDSGLMHLAAAMGTRVVGLFGPSDERVTGPQGEGHRVVSADASCRPCLSKKCEAGRVCMTGITPEMVLEACGSGKQW